MPKSWKKLPLTQLGTLVSGGTPSRSRSEYWGGDFPWLSAKDLKSFWLDDSIEHLTEEGTRNGTRVVPAGTILILVRGMTLMKDVPIGVTTRPVAFNQDLRGLLPSKVVDGTYLGFWLAAHRHRLMAFVDQAGHGTGRLATEAIESLDVDVPERAEQRAIVRTIETWDRAVEATIKLVKLKRRFKRGLMQQLLTGRHRFPEFASRPWREVRIGDALREVHRTFKLDPQAQYRLVSIRRRSGGFFDREVRFGHQISYPTLEQIHAGDFVIARRQVLHGAMATVPTEFHGACVSNAYAILEAHNPDEFHVPFFNFVSQQHRLYHLAYRCSYGVAIEKMFFRLDWFLKESLRIPPTLAEQRKITAVLATVDREIALLEQQLAALREQKKGLMQKLLTGRYG